MSYQLSLQRTSVFLSATDISSVLDNLIGFYSNCSVITSDTLSVLSYFVVEMLSECIKFVMKIISRPIKIKLLFVR